MIRLWDCEEGQSGEEGVGEWFEETLRQRLHTL